MTWKAFHTRGETLRSVIATADVRRDGVLPMDVPGVAETFRDELDLLGALQLKWHTRLSGHVERAFVHQPVDLERAVAVGWSNAAAELAGVRLVLDHYRAQPLDERMAEAMARATAKEHHYLAVMAGRAGLRVDEEALRIGARIEEAARALHRGAPVVDHATEPLPEDVDGVEHRKRHGSLLDRLRAVIAA